MPRRHAVDDAVLLALNPRNDRIRSIMGGLAQGHRLETVRHVGLSMRSAPDEDALLDAAETSAQRQYAGRVVPMLKRGFLRAQYRWCYHRFTPDTPLIVMCWNGIKGHRFLAMQAARRRGHGTLYLEEAPLPGRLTVDFEGVNYGSSLPRNAEFFRRWLAKSPGIVPGNWRQVRADLTARAATHRDDVGQRPADETLGRQRFVFVPLQVPGDSQITVYGDWITSVEAMIGHLERAAAALPDGWHLRIKEHPSARVSFAERLSALPGDRIVVDNATDTMAQVAAAQAVLTINSSVGFESFFFDKPVIVLGHAFYAFDGTATKARSVAELSGLLARPDALGFDAALRDAFMSYVVERHFPSEADIIAGRVTLKDILARDDLRDQILSGVQDR